VARRLAPLVAVLCLAAGCGGGNDEAGVKNAVNRLYAGFAERDAGKVCGSLTKAQQREVAKGASGQGVAPGSCRQVMGFALGFIGSTLKDAKQAKVTKVKVDGDKARATVVFKGKSGVLGVTKEDGDWKVSNFNLSGV
jgi:hypothetical protein